jgi:hypothetical protein
MQWLAPTLSRNNALIEGTRFARIRETFPRSLPSMRSLEAAQRLDESACFTKPLNSGLLHAFNFKTDERGLGKNSNDRHSILHLQLPFPRLTLDRVPGTLNGYRASRHLLLQGLFVCGKLPLLPHRSKELSTTVC